MSPELGPAASAKTEKTRLDLVDAAKAILRTEGFSAATARNIAAKAGCNQGLVFYHFGSVGDLLLAALDNVSRERREKYEEELVGIETVGQLVDLATRIFTEDLDTGNAALLVEMIVGASAIPGLGPKVKERMDPWVQFASDAIGSRLANSPFGAIVAAEDMGRAIVAFYLGLEMISHLDGNREHALRLFEIAKQFSGFADTMLAGGGQ